MDNKGKKLHLFHSFSDSHDSSVSVPKLLIVGMIFIALGIGTGYLLSRSYSAVKGVSTKQLNQNVLLKGSTFGSDDTATFKDTTEGIITRGGVKGEGQYHLTRAGGESQNVYMTSSVVDLSKFIGHKVKVWGQTQKAHSAGWLMDVGKVLVLE